MLLHTIVRFILTIVGSLAAFYLGAILFNAIGYLSDYEMQHVGWMYNQLLSPITSISWTTRKTILVIVTSLVLQAFLMSYLFRRWSYRPIKKIDPLARQAPVQPIIEE